MEKDQWFVAYRTLCCAAGIPADDCEALWETLPDMGRRGIWLAYLRMVG